jgi:hypothetical protein
MVMLCCHCLLILKFAESDPDDETLKAALHQYSKEKLSTDQRLARLEAEHNLSIKFVIHCHHCYQLLKIVIHLLIRSATLYKLNKKFGVPSVRKPPPADIAMQAVLEKVASDPSQKRGVGTIGTLLSNEGMPLPRFVYYIYLLFGMAIILTMNLVISFVIF